MLEKSPAVSFFKNVYLTQTAVRNMNIFSVSSFYFDLFSGDR